MNETKGLQVLDKADASVEEEIERRLGESDEPFESLAAYVELLKSEGYTQDDVKRVFENVRAKLRIENREAEEDDIMNVMDCIWGFCSLDRRLF